MKSSKIVRLPLYAQKNSPSVNGNLISLSLQKARWLTNSECLSVQSVMLSLS